MEKEQRNALRRAVEKARQLLEQESSDQLEGVYNILPDGSIAEAAPGDPILRQQLLDLVEHYRAGGASDKESVARAARETAFTILNRFAALKMAERRGLVRECITKGLESEGIQELLELAPALKLEERDTAYQLLLGCLMDEVSLGLKVLFDRRSASSVLWPRPVAMDALLEVLNAPELADLWEDDETIGWIYQYFNGDDVKEMRKASSVPRNSRELAVRNQFFTPRYVVEFLTDNTLGRIWYDMREGDTGLRENCRMLVYTPNEVFLEKGQELPEDEGTDEESEAPQTSYIRHREKKDPRDLKILDPACGSGHFLLYCYDLLETIYSEAWEAQTWSAFSETDRSLREDYPSRQDLLLALPDLILRYNLYGIEIDPRAAQVTSLALWLRAQRAYKNLDLKPVDRTGITRSNIVVAEPMPGETELREEFAASLEPRVLGELFLRICDETKLAGEAGSLLKLEKSMGKAIQEAEEKTGRLFAAGDQEFWDSAEQRILEALEAYARGVEAENQRRLFVDDASQGVAFIGLCRTSFDVVLMNPPFGAAAKKSKSYIEATYPRSKQDLYAAFVERGLEWLVPMGRLGAITSRTGFFISSFQTWREEILLSGARPTVVADLGLGVMDAAMVEAAAYCVEVAG